MNTLSWLIYLAEVVGNLGSALGGFSAFMFITSGIAIAGCVFAMALGYDSGDDNALAFGKRNIKWGILGFILAVLIGLTSQFVPSTKTVYAIAASEMGEVVVNNQETREVLQVLKDKIMEQLKPTEIKE